MNGLRAPAPAKINPVLRVLARRDDGFHELETLFQAIALSERPRTRRATDGGVARAALSIVVSDTVRPRTLKGSQGGRGCESPGPVNARV